MAKANAKTNEKDATRHCPYCDEEIYDLNLPICGACHTKIVYCTNCHEPIPKGQKACLKCGANIAPAKK
ncbi:MAG: zinc-ribbon domain-containing protein [Dehalococcoidales bacterium]|nr:zinc-ribbon domain-containing protein [Dehalococcoidales bacterium]